MDTVQDFEDLLELLDRHDVRYLVIGGLAFVYHAKPRYTKDIDIWLDSDVANVERANVALSEFGVPELLNPTDPDEILQLGNAPNRIDLLRAVVGLEFGPYWERRIESRYGRARACWIDLEGLIDIKSRIDHPRHREDVRILEQVRERRNED